MYRIFFGMIQFLHLLFVIHAQLKIISLNGMKIRMLVIKYAQMLCRPQFVFPAVTIRPISRVDKVIADI